MSNNRLRLLLKFWVLAGIGVVGFVLSIVGYAVELPWHPWIADRVSEQIAIIYFGVILALTPFVTLPRKNMITWYVASMIFLYLGSIWKVMSVKMPGLGNAVGGLILFWGLALLFKHTFSESEKMKK